MKIELEKHKLEWINLFKIEKENIIEVLGREKVKVEHIGSTSLPGVSAKPIIDIMVGVHGESQLDTNICKIIDLGYVYVKKYENIMPFRRYFFKLADKKINTPQIIGFEEDAEKYDSGNYQHESHIHMVKINSDFWTNHLLFRDHLLKNKNDRFEYNKLKNSLARQEWNNVNEYTKAKSSFIIETLEKARRS